jgi:hypothetical protein
MELQGSPWNSKASMKPLGHCLEKQGGKLSSLRTHFSKKAAIFLFFHFGFSKKVSFKEEFIAL